MREMAAASPLAVFRLAISITAPCKLQLQPSISLAEIRGNIFSESAYGYGRREDCVSDLPAYGQDWPYNA